MKITRMILGGLLLLVSQHVMASTCPDPSLGETAADCPWASVARELILQADQGLPVGPRLAELLPELANQIQREGSESAAHTFWGLSLNYDELAKGTIVHPAILDSLAEQIGVAPRRDRIVHAGMEHTYGYLFSVLRTSFGYKRARWVLRDLDAGFGLPTGVLGPSTTEGTFLTNVTYFMGSIAFRSDELFHRMRLDGLRSMLPAAVRDYPYGNLETTRLEETIRLKGEFGKEESVVLRTDFVRMLDPSASQSGNTHLLVYSILDSRLERPELITAFPVNLGFVQMALNPQNLGEDQTIITRYNAYVPGVTGTSFKGLRKRIDSQP